jgi:pyruvate/2-oxoglutarate dehydrogenase complex dihydrolipoamide dehydrogenase (E3) component
MADYELVVLGAGATGLSAARAARRAGRKVAIVEAERPGGDCTHYGCIPSKALLETARRVQAARSGAAYGFSALLAVDFPAVMERVRAVVAEVEQDESPEVLRQEGIDLLRGWGVVTGPTTLTVNGREVSFERLVVATGSRATAPPIDGLDEVASLDNRTVFDLQVLPDHLVVLGGGPIGVELAQAFRRLGARVTLLEAAPSLLGREEPEAQQVVRTVLEREGVTVRTGVKATRVEHGPVVHLSDGIRIDCSHLLVAAGRTPATDGLGLDSAGVALEHGRVVTDEHLQAAETVWAAGDCTSPLQLTHVGDEQGRLAARNAFAGAPWKRGGGSWDDSGIPWVTFTEPEVGRVGLTEAEAVREHGSGVMVSTYWDRHGDRARTAGQTDGFVKLVAVPGKVGGITLGKLVGMTAVGPMAGELIAEGALSLRAGTLVGRLAQTVHAYPTWSLSTRLAAAQFFGQGRERARPGRAAVAPVPAETS